jgi:hypothetical protein
MGDLAMRIEEFAGRSPTFVPELFFAGRTQAWGIFEDRFGRLRREFEVEIDGRWDGRVLTLDERFDFSDGEQDRRVWRLTKLDEGRYRAACDEVAGEPLVEVAGNALHFSYAIGLQIGNRHLPVRFDDWMFLQPHGVLVNRARVSKCGLRIGEATIFFSKPSAAHRDVGE